MCDGKLIYSEMCFSLEYSSLSFLTFSVNVLDILMLVFWVVVWTCNLMLKFRRNMSLSSALKMETVSICAVFKAEVG